MDTKALAKSKRAHSLHHSKKHHPAQASKAGGAVRSANAKKPLGKQAQEGDKSRPSLDSNALPSNWDRYGEENDSGITDNSSNSMNRTSDIIVPKSKGADYSYLIAEAKSQSQTSGNSQSFPSLDDDLTGFNQGVGSLLSVWGQSLLSRTEDDTFNFDDKATGNNEAPFFSLNLHALAEQLAKVDISQRLFIESDIIPPEMFLELQGSSKLEDDQDRTTRIEVATKDEIAIHNFVEEDKIVDPCREISSSKTSRSSRQVVSSSSDKRLNPLKQAENELWQSDGNGRNVNHNAKQKEEKSRFEAAVAEAELDMLLNSFNDKTFLDAPAAPPTNSAAELLKKDSVSSSSKSALLTANLDDSIDDLLNGTSPFPTNQNGPLQPREVTAAASKSKVLDDFDAWLDTI